MSEPLVSPWSERWQSLARRIGIVEIPMVLGAIVVGVVLRFVAASPMWLDEALSVNIASAPLSDIGDLLRRDGHPPLYYWLLHGWMELFGSSATAARSLSGVFGLVALALIHQIALRLGGHRLARYSVAIMALNPFAIRYSSEARMYEMVTALALVGWLLVDGALFRADAAKAPISRWRLVGIWLVSGMLLLTHYWAIFFLAAVGMGLLGIIAWGRDQLRRRDTIAVTAAIAASGVFFIPWLSAFRYQSEHTGTPWAPRSRPTRVFSESMIDWAGGIDPEALLLLGAMVVLGAIGLTAVRNTGPLTLGPIPKGWRRRVLWLVGATLGVGAVASFATNSAFAGRYSSVIFPFAILLVGAGVAALPSAPVRTVVLAIVLVLSLGSVTLAISRDRTQAGQIAAVINESAQSGDVVIACPDQLGPALSRLVDVEGVRVLRAPDLGDAALVDWVDYADQIAAIRPVELVDRILAAAGDDTIWLVWQGAYRLAGPPCDELTARLAAIRPGEAPIIDAQPGEYFEAASLIRLAGR